MNPVSLILIFGEFREGQQECILGTWIWSPSISPLGVDLDLILLNFPFRCGPGGGGGASFFGGRVSLAGGASFLGGLLGSWVSLAGGSPWWGSPWQGVSLAGGASFLGGLLLGGLLGREVSLAGGSPWQGGLLGRGSPWRWVSLAGGCLLLGGSPWQGGLLGWGCLLLGGGSIPACTETDPPMDRITDTSKNITLATSSLRPVKMFLFSCVCVGQIDEIDRLISVGAPFLCKN